MIKVTLLLRHIVGIKESKFLEIVSEKNGEKDSDS
jgi:hypothetical protein